MFRAKAFLPAPDIIVGESIDVEYVGPLARSQRMEEATAVERLYQLAMQIVQLDPTIMDIINHDEAIRARAGLLGVPKSVLRGVNEVAELREARAQQQQQQQQMEMAQQQAEIGAQQSKTATEMAKPETKKVIDEAADVAEDEGLM
jgi:hypothetical protein